ncbi:hypothetical protein ACS2CQ_23510 [Bacillus cereus group sp. BceL295]|uniref:Uncharacterized protein n=1 Tax=Bacillus bombysepticus str. Wang TaxID=1330043 RepID=A0A9W3PU95_9BACI|nr:hypothetical protein CY96_29885 [Bacillus bombysepticus str. Wang]
MHPIHQNLFYQYYDIKKEIASGKVVRPQFILIFGFRSEFEGNPEINQKRAQFVWENETYMTSIGYYLILRLGIA